MTASKIGASFAFTTTAPEFDVLTEASDKDGNGYIYVQANGALDQYDAVVIDEDGQCNVLSLTTGDARDGQWVGAVQVAFADNEYGWVLRKGIGQVNAIASTAANAVNMFNTATDGHVDATSTSGDESIIGMVLTTARGGTNGEAPVMLNNPVLGATV